MSRKVNGCPDCPSLQRIADDALAQLTIEKEKVTKLCREVRAVKDLLTQAKGEINSARVYIEKAQEAFQKFTREELTEDLQ